MKDYESVIDRTNRFYVEMSKPMLSGREYEVLQKLLIEKMTLGELADIYGVTGESVHQIYESTYEKVKGLTQLLTEVNGYKPKLEQLQNDAKYEPVQIQNEENKNEVDLQRMLHTSSFPFSKRMNTMFKLLGVQTIGELAAIPLKEFLYFRGFKNLCKKELVAFIEFENIEHLFEGFSKWKKKPIP